MTELTKELLSLKKQSELTRIKNQYGLILVRLMGNPTKDERDTWPVQVEMAKSYKAGDETAGSFLTGLLTETERKTLGVSGADVMADKIISKSTAGAQRISLVGGLRRTAEKEIEAATTIKEIDDAIKAFNQNVRQTIAQINS